MNNFLNMFMKICDPETTEIITNAEHAYQDGEITKEQRDEVIKSCLTAETERLMGIAQKGTSNV